MHLVGLVKSPDHVCSRYRLAAYAPLLASRGHELELRSWPASWWSAPDFYRRLREADVVIVLRRLLPSWELALLRRSVKHLIFDLDDAVFLRDSYASRGSTSARRLRGFRRMMAAADAVVAGNAFLADHATRCGGKRVQVVPTCVDPGRYPVAVHERGGAGVQLVWIGSSSTLQGLEQTRALWDEIGRRLPGVALKLICDRPLSLRHLPVEYAPWSEATESAELASADIGVSWIPDDDWSRGKCALKTLQYMAAGLPVVANPVGVQGNLVRHGDNGFLAETPDEWFSAVERLAGDPELRRRMGQAGRRLVEEKFSIQAGAARWQTILNAADRSLAVADRKSEPAGWTDITAGTVRWSVAPAIQRALLGPEGLRLEAWLQTGQACLVKQGPHRLVYRVDLGDDVVYVKHNLLPDTRAWLRQLVRPSKARMEYDRAIALTQRGVATVEPLAIGERLAAWGAGDSYLVTRSLENTQTLNSFMALTLVPLAPPRQARIGQRLARALGLLVAQLHNTGVRHNDFHAANILVRLEAGDEPRLFLIDLNSVDVGKPLEWTACLENLVIFTRWFVPRVSRSDRLRFWRTYFEARGLGAWPKNVRGPREHFAMARELERRAGTSTLAFWKRRDPRSLANNRYYRRLRAPGVCGHAVTDLDPAVVARLLADPDALFGQVGVKLLKDSRSSTVAELEIATETGRRRLIYKRFRVTTWTDPWLSLLRRSPALHSWLMGHGFRERCLPTARPLVVLHRVQGRRMCEGYLLAEKIEDATDLHGFLEEAARLGPDRERKRRRWCIAVVARAVRQLHSCRLSHRDLKAANLLVQRGVQEQGSPYQPVPPGPPEAPISSLLPLPAWPLSFIDLVGVRLHARLPRSRRVQNLARLNASFYQSRVLSRTDRLRFLRVYLEWNLRGKGVWKRWWRAIDAATLAKATRNARSGRVLA